MNEAITIPSTPTALLSSSIKFNILLVIGAPSFICYVFIIIYMLTHKNHRTAPHNYCLLIILHLQFFCNILDIPSQMYFYQNGQVMFESAIYCYAWQYISYSTWPINIILLAWASFERHILIFHDRILRSKWKNISLHYAPPIVIIVYVTCFYIYLFAYYTCKTPYLFQQNYCNSACYTANLPLMLLTRMLNYMFPAMMTVIFNVSLLIRVIYSKHRHQQTFVWRRYKKMTYQLISISFLSSATVLPYSIVRVLSVTSSNIISKQMQEMFSFLPILETLYLPFIYLASTSELWTAIRTKICRRRTRQIGPVILGNL